MAGFLRSASTRTTLLFLVLGGGVAAGCGVDRTGIAGALTAAANSGGAGGSTGTGGQSDAGVATGGTGGPAMGGATGSDAATTPRDAADAIRNAGGAPGSGGASGTDAPSEAGGVTGRGGAQGSGGATGADAVPATGGIVGVGGLTGAGGGTGGSSSPDGARDMADARRDGPRDGTEARRLDTPLGSEDVPGLDTPPDMPFVESDGSYSAEAPISEAGVPLVLVWSDEFDGEANTGVDVAKWSYVTWAPGAVNNELQQYTSSTNNVFHDGAGHLILRGLYNPVAANPYTSGRIDTNGKVALGPGHRIEVRAMLPAGIGSFPAILMKGTSGTWPDSGALGLMEQYGQDKSWFYATAYAGNAAGSGKTDKTQYTFPDALTASVDFHVYSLDWYPDHVVFQVDGHPIVSSTYATSSPFYNITEYLVLDVAIGGDMGGTVDNTDFPMDMVVDYVRVYAF